MTENRNSESISTKTHGMIDYSTAATLMAAPYVLGFADGGAETWVPALLGATTIGQSLLTDYELGVIPLIPMSTHLKMDIGSGALLAVSPFLFGSYKKGIMSWLPHVMIGVMEIAVAMMTSSTPEEPESVEANVDHHPRFVVRRMDGSFAQS